MNVATRTERTVYKNTINAVDTSLRKGLLPIVRYFTVHQIAFGEVDMYGSLVSALYDEVREYKANGKKRFRR